MGATAAAGAGTAAARFRAAEGIAGEGETLVTFVVADQPFGVPVSRVQDVLAPENIAPVPLAPAAVKGAINLRGRIVTVIDVRTRLGLPRCDDATGAMGVTVEHHGELYTLLVDRIGDIAQLSRDRWEEKPSTLDPAWREVTSGVFRLDEGLLVVLDVDRLLAVA
jgi:purine-binding chemotaxis protein CheW